MTLLEQARTALAAATQTKDADLAAIWIASARIVADRLRRELDAFEAVLVAAEREMVRARHGDAEQLALEGRK